MKRVVTTLSVCCVKRTCQQRLLGKWLCRLINWIGGNIICNRMNKLRNIKCSGFKWVNNFLGGISGRGGGALAPSALSCVRPCTDYLFSGSGWIVVCDFRVVGSSGFFHRGRSTWWAGNYFRWIDAWTILDGVHVFCCRNCGFWIKAQ